MKIPHLSTPPTPPSNVAREEISSYINTITLIPRQNFKFQVSKFDKMV